MVSTDEIQAELLRARREREELRRELQQARDEVQRVRREQSINLEAHDALQVGAPGSHPSSFPHSESIKSLIDYPILDFLFNRTLQAFCTVDTNAPYYRRQGVISL